jgi:hypothetical protein
VEGGRRRKYGSIKVEVWNNLLDFLKNNSTKMSKV